MGEVLREGTYTVLAAEVKASGGARGHDQQGVPFREIALDRGGVVVGGAVAFRSAAQAARCAVAIQEAAPTAEVAMGLHAGEVHAAKWAEARPVVVAARLATLARGGQVLASAVVRELAGADPALHFGAGREVGLPGLSGRMACTTCSGVISGGRCGW